MNETFKPADSLRGMPTGEVVLDSGASAVEIGANGLRMTLNVAQARALRDWLNSTLPDDVTPSQPSRQRLTLMEGVIAGVCLVVAFGFFQAMMDVAAFPKGLGPCSYLSEVPPQGCYRIRNQQREILIVSPDGAEVPFKAEGRSGSK